MADNGFLQKEKNEMDKKLLLNKPVIICGADIVGRVLFDVCKKTGINVVGFSDYKPSLTGTEFCGLKVYYTPDISKKFKDATYIISVMTIRDVVESLHSQGIDNWIAGGLLLDKIDTTQTSYLLDDEKYQVESCRISHHAFLKKNYVFLRSIDIMITEKCSLKCKSCSNLMQYFEHPRNYNIDDLNMSIYTLLKYTDEIMEARILGGDTFMHPDWPRMVAWIGCFQKIRKVIVYTNGIIVPKDISVLSHPKVIVYLTDYGKLSKNLSKLISLFEENKIRYKIVKLNEWLDCSSIQKHNRTTKQNDKLFQECIATNLITLTDGKVFRCPYAASAFRLGVVGNVKTDYVDITQPPNKKIMDEYIKSRKAMSICDYCSSRIITNKVIPAVQIKEPLKYKRVK